MHTSSKSNCQMIYHIQMIYIDVMMPDIFRRVAEIVIFHLNAVYIFIMTVHVGIFWTSELYIRSVFVFSLVHLVEEFYHILSI